MSSAKDADQLVIMLGIDADIECEGRDRTNTTLPGFQEELAIQLLALEKPTVVVLLNGGILSVDRLAANSSNCAIVEAWNPGIRGAPALAKALFGDTNAWGKLPVTVYDSSFSSSVEMIDMSMTTGLGRTYKYWNGPVLYKFGFGLSYTDFALSWKQGQQPTPVTVSSAADILKLDCALRNTGSILGDEVLMLFQVPRGVRRPAHETVRLPHRALRDFDRVTLAPGATASVSFRVNASQLCLVDSQGNCYLYAGTHELRVDRGVGASLSLQVDVVTTVLIDTLL
jgi:hypothetical protein